jgi:hypothetical protein
MKKTLYILIGVLCISLISACDETNDFTTREDLVICTGDCFYQNISNYSHFIACDDSVTGYISISYRNGTSITTNQKMTRNGGHFEYNASGILNQSLVEIYNGQFKFFREDGWDDPVDFLFSVSGVSETSIGNTGGAFSLPSKVLNQEIDIEGIKEEIKENVKTYFILTLIILAFIMLVWSDIRKKKIKNLAKEVNKIQIKDKKWKK